MRLRSPKPTKEETAKMPWTYEPGAKYVDVCEAILTEEERYYKANGRSCGGLGNLISSFKAWAG